MLKIHLLSFIAETGIVHAAWPQKKHMFAALPQK
jgi:hypothetical protein